MSLAFLFFCRQRCLLEGSAKAQLSAALFMEPRDFSWWLETWAISREHDRTPHSVLSLQVAGVLYMNEGRKNEFTGRHVSVCRKLHA
jgi:hypothetical protein